MINPTLDVMRMMYAFGQKIPTEFVIPDQSTLDLRHTLMAEECAEMLTAWRNIIAIAQVIIPVPESEGSDIYTITESELDDLKTLTAEFMKEFCDVLFVTLGTVASLGLNPEPFWESVLENNLQKASNKVVRDDGKITKGDAPKLNLTSLVSAAIEYPVDSWKFNFSEEIHKERSATMSRFFGEMYFGMSIPETSE